MSIRELNQLAPQIPSLRTPVIRQLERLLGPKTDAELASMAEQASLLTRRNFGYTMRMFAPLYLSNECINNCAYCGFSRDNPIFRVTLTIEQVVKEARHLAEQGFRQVLLVAGEHPKFVSNGYLAECIRAIKGFIPTVAVEVATMETADYIPLVMAGAEGLVVYQETYDENAYAEYHTLGPKKDFHWRMACPQRGYDAGFRRIGLGALFGLSEPRMEALRLGAHLADLQQSCWKAFFTVAFARLRPAAGSFTPLYSLTDRDFVQTICAFRICFPHTGIVLSTREAASLRDAILPLGITMMSAGSHTEPGGYTQQGTDDIHLTVRGRRVELTEKTACDTATGQFEIADKRSPAEVAAMLASRGFDPVWKDWDEAILADQ